jgi:hypothetical protein
MKTLYKISIYLVLFVTPLFATDFKRIASSNSQDGLIDNVLPKCASLMKECLISDENLRTNCLFAVSKHPFCEGSSLGTLTYRRWQLSGEFHLQDSVNKDNFLNNNCLLEFDNNFTKIISNDNLVNQANLKSLSQSLELCNQQNSINFVRP